MPHRYTGLHHQLESFLLFWEACEEAGTHARTEMDRVEKRLGIDPPLDDPDRTHEERIRDAATKVGHALILRGNLSAPERDDVLMLFQQVATFLSQMTVFFGKLSKESADELEACGLLADKYQRPDEQLREARIASESVEFRQGFRGQKNSKNEREGFDSEFPLVNVSGNVFLIGHTADGRQVWRRSFSIGEGQLTDTG